jgi:hypothetical protein
MPKGILLNIKEGPKNLRTDLGTEILIAHLSVSSQILQTAVYSFGGGEFEVGNRRVEQGVGRKSGV